MKVLGDPLKQLLEKKRKEKGSTFADLISVNWKNKLKFADISLICERTHTHLFVLLHEEIEFGDIVCVCALTQIVFCWFFGFPSPT